MTKILWCVIVIKCLIAFICLSAYEDVYRLRWDICILLVFTQHRRVIKRFFERRIADFIPFHSFLFDTITFQNLCKKTLPLGIEPRTYRITADRSADWATEALHDRCYNNTLSTNVLTHRHYTLPHETMPKLMLTDSIPFQRAAMCITHRHDSKKPS